MLLTPKPPGFEGGGRLDIMSPPVFFPPHDNEEGFLHAVFVPKTPDEKKYATVVYITRDGGINWRCATPLKPPGEVDFIDADNGWAWVFRLNYTGTADPVEGTLYRTNDGGGTWIAVDPDQILKGFLQQGYNVKKLDFVNKTAGWALLEAPRVLLAAPGHPNRPATTLLRTADGGQTWTSIAPFLDQAESR